MRDVIPGRTSLVFPDASGAQESSGARPMCAILLSAVSHHPLGMLAPNYTAVGKHFEAMTRELSADATAHGFLGASNWLNTSRSTGNELASILYFENDEALHAYAHGKLHTDSMLWWREEEKAGRTKHVGIMHEVFAAPNGGWEGVYLNYHPTGMFFLFVFMMWKIANETIGLGSTTKEVVRADGKSEWVSPLVRAKGKLAYSKGRMGREFDEKEWEAFGATMGDEEKM
jgi:heme-degrading monooxygenase HmoA